ncbi:MAG: hypothetical protein ACOY4F_12005 [Thermodesulfobacteriota bacterium]
MPRHRPSPTLPAHPAPVSRRAPALCLVAAVVFCCLAATPARAGVIYVGETHYRMEDGRKFLGPWDVTQETIMAKEAAVVVMEERADQRMVQLLLQTLESLNVPTLFTKIKDFKALKERGVIVPHPKPAQTAPKTAP